MLIGNMVDVEALDKKVWDTAHVCPLRAVRKHFGYGMYPHLEKYRTLFREGLDLPEGRPDYAAELIREIEQAA